MEFGHSNDKTETKMERLNIHQKAGHRDYTDAVEALLAPIGAP